MREKMKRILYKDAADMKERLFRLILLVGLIVSPIAIIAGLTLDDPLTNAIPIIGLLAVILVASFVTFKLRKAEFASNLFAVFIIGIIFPFVFFSSGGIESGATVWFVLGILYIFLMFRGFKLVLFLMISVSVDIATYVLAYTHPQLIVPLNSKLAIYSDSLFAVIIVGIAVGFIMRFQLQSYEKERERTLAQRDEIEKIGKSKDAFFANMSHEIRTPINTIIGLNEMILREDINDEVAEDALRVRNASKILLALINDILDFSQIESDRMSIVPTTYQTKELFDDIIGLMQVRMNEKNLDFHVNIDSDLPTAMLGDEMRIKQILINLLTNAAKYTQKGSVTFSVQGEPPHEEDGRELLTIAVSDTGIGIKKEDLDSLYDYFKRIDREKNRKIEGSGLGLTITKRLVNLMGGTITVDSIYRKGSVFTVTLEQPIMDARPIGDVDYLRTLQGQERRHYKQSFEAPLAKILIVDDNETNLMVVSKLLRATKVQIDTARNGEECLEMIKKKRYHAILLDSMMPIMDGPETLKAIRRQGGRQIPVIVVTANNSAADRQRYLDLGFDGYLAKPIDGNLMELEILKLLPEELIEYRINMDDSDPTSVSTTLRKKRKKIQITTDCVSDLSKEYLEEFDIKMIYAYVETENGIFRDTIEIDADNLARHLSQPESTALAVSAPVEEYEAFYAEALAEAEEVIHISMASGAGKSYHNALLAAKGFDHVHVINCGHISCGEGMLVLAACRLLRNGCNQVDLLCREIEQLKKQIETSFLMPNIQSFYESGHVGKMLGTFGDMMDLHPVVQMRQNDTKLIGFRSGNLDKAKKSFLRRLLKKKNRIDPRIVIITHASCTLKQQKEFVDEVLKYIPFQKVIVERASVSCSSNSGLGTMGIAYLTKADGKVYNKYDTPISAPGNH